MSSENAHGGRHLDLGPRLGIGNRRLPPVIRVEVEGIRETVVQHLNQHIVDTIPAIGEEIARQLDDYNMVARVRDAVEQYLPHILDETIKSICQEAVYALRPTIDGLATTAIEKALKARS